MSDCIIFQGFVDQSGYGRLTIKGRGTSAHRYAYEQAFGKIPEGLCVCHKCDNTLCINPEHLFLGTHGDNARDRSEKGRTARLFGGDNPNSRLSNEQRKEIEQLYGNHLRTNTALNRRKKPTYRDVARKYGVTDDTIRKVVN